MFTLSTCIAINYIWVRVYIYICVCVCLFIHMQIPSYIEYLKV